MTSNSLKSINNDNLTKNKNNNNNNNHINNTNNSVSTLTSHLTTTTTITSLPTMTNREDNFGVLTYEQLRRLDHLLNQPVPINSRINYPTLQLRLKDFIRLLSRTLLQRRVRLKDVRINGGLASYILSRDHHYDFSDIDIIFACDLLQLNTEGEIPSQTDSSATTPSYSHSNYNYSNYQSNGSVESAFSSVCDVVKEAVFDCLISYILSDEHMSSQFNHDTLNWVLLKDAYVNKMVKIYEHNSSSSPSSATTPTTSAPSSLSSESVDSTRALSRWSLISLYNRHGQNVELKFVDKMRRQFQFSVDGFQIDLSALLAYYDALDSGLQQQLMNEQVYPTVRAESMYGNFKLAISHLDAKLIATHAPEEIRGGGLLKYCNLLVKGYMPECGQASMNALEKYMCSRFFIDFSDVRDQQHKLCAYMDSHFQNEPQMCLVYLNRLYRVVNASTVCLMGHERKQTLSLIESLSIRFGNNTKDGSNNNLISDYMPSEFYNTNVNKINNNNNNDMAISWSSSSSSSSSSMSHSVENVNDDHSFYFQNKNSNNSSGYNNNSTSGVHKSNKKQQIRYQNNNNNNNNVSNQQRQKNNNRCHLAPSSTTLALTNSRKSYYINGGVHQQYNNNSINSNFSSFYNCNRQHSNSSQQYFQQTYQHQYQYNLNNYPYQQAVNSAAASAKTTNFSANEKTANIKNDGTRAHSSLNVSTTSSTPSSTSVSPSPSPTPLNAESPSSLQQTNVSEHSNVDNNSNNNELTNSKLNPIIICSESVSSLASSLASSQSSMVPSPAPSPPPLAVFSLYSERELDEEDEPEITELTNCESGGEKCLNMDGVDCINSMQRASVASSVSSTSSARSTSCGRVLYCKISTANPSIEVFENCFCPPALPVMSVVGIPIMDCCYAEQADQQLLINQQQYLSNMMVTRIMPSSYYYQ